jgi:hypothetical protein
MDVLLQFVVPSATGGPTRRPPIGGRRSGAGNGWTYPLFYGDPGVRLFPDGHRDTTDRRLTVVFPALPVTTLRYWVSANIPRRN